MSQILYIPKYLCNTFHDINASDGGNKVGETGQVRALGRKGFSCLLVDIKIPPADQSQQEGRVRTTSQ